jgi:BioD-like phosphotransacetylase family protein
MPSLLITSISPRQGKSAIAALIASHIAGQGRTVALIVANGGGGDDLTALLPGATVLTSDPGSAAAAASGAGTDVAIVEGPSGDPAANLNIARALDARVIVIGNTGDNLAAAARAYGDRLAGVLVNSLGRYRSHAIDTELKPALESAGIPYLGAVPEDRRLVASTMRQITEHLGGEITQWGEHANELADHVLLGGMVLDWGVHYFASRENSIVMVRGDRPDIQMAALATPIKGLILTEGIAPLEYVHYEADQEEVPVTVVAKGTHDSAALLEGLLETVQFDHPDKLLRLREIADGAVNFTAIEEALAQPVTG